mgnify:CR=1 FL=1
MGEVLRRLRSEFARSECQKLDVVAFGIFHAGYGPNNYGPFEAEFENWPGPPGSSPPKAE